MGKGAGRAAVIAILSAVAIGGRAEAGPATGPRVVLHLTDYVSVPADLLHSAQAAAARVYARVDVTIEWTDGWAALAPSDGALHLDVILLTENMPGYRESDPRTFAKASRVSRRAYVFFGRVLEHARATFSDPARVLAVVLAHELGHLLLPQEGHSGTGLMRAGWAGPLFDVPPLSRAEGAAIRSRLTGRR